MRDMKMIILSQIQEKLAQAIRQSGMSQTSLAQKLGIKQPTISHYLKGDKMPALDTLANLCVILDLDANDILCVNQTTGTNNSNINIAGNYINNNGNINFN